MPEANQSFNNGLSRISSFNFEHYKRISDSNDYVIISDHTNHIVWVNDGFTKLTGYKVKEVTGKMASAVLRGGGSDPLSTKIIDEKTKLRVPFREHVLNYRKDGSHIWLSLSVIPLFNKDKIFEGYVTIGSDITYIKENEIRLNRNTRRLSIINKLLAGLIDSAGNDEVFEKVATSIAEIFENISRLHALILDTKKLNFIAVKGYKFFNQNIFPISDEIPKPSVKLVKFMNRRDVYLVKDLTKLKKENRYTTYFKSEGIKTLVVFPLFIEEEICSFLLLTSTEANAFTDDDIALLTEIKNAISVALKQAQLKKKIDEKNDQIKNKNQEITDSIRYAKRIQEAILPDKKTTSKLLPNSFFLYLPKDIVSGDFFWVNERNDKVFFTVADCTGHGVPGAFMSMIGTSLLNQIVLGKKISSSNEVLDELRRKIIVTLKQNGISNNQKDGMDMSFCVWNRMKYTLEIAAANNPVLIIRSHGDVLYDFFSGQLNPDSTSEDGKIKLYEIKADRQPVGVSGKAEVPFSNKEIKLHSGDTVYLFSDGIIDQFGGEKGKKIMIRRLKEILISIYHLEMKEQEKFLKKFFLSWKGELEQVDDVLIAGVRF